MFGLLSAFKGGQKVLLPQAHDTIRRRVEKLEEKLGKNIPDPQKARTVEQILRAHDPDLAALYREMKSTGKDVAKLRKQYGEDDPMVEIATYSYESARGRYQTRLMELEEQHEIISTARSQAEAEQARHNAAAVEAAKKRREQEQLEREHTYMLMLMVLIGLLMSRETKSVTIAPSEDLPGAIMRTAREAGLDQIGRTIGHVANPAFSPQAASVA